MTVSKFTNQPTNKEIPNKINEIIDNLGGGGSSTLSGLSDVTLTSPSNGQVLSYDGSKWVNATKTLVTIRDWSV